MDKPMSHSPSPVIVEFAGGLGNQLFQYGFGRFISTISARPLMLDTTAVQRDIKRSLEIRSFLSYSNVPLVHTRKQLFKLLGDRVLTSLSKWEKLIHFVHPYHPLGLSTSYLMLNEERFPIHLRPYTFEKEIPFVTELVQSEINIPLYVRGYWQKCHYISQVMDILAQELQLDDGSVAAIQTVADIARSHAIDWDTVTSVHVRRGDYLASDFHTFLPACTKRYYHNAVQHVLKHNPYATFMVFSDDPLWCAAHLDIGVPFVLATHHVRDTLAVQDHCTAMRISRISTAEELLLMAQCPHHILCNSSFSWWGAMLPQTIIQSSIPQGTTVAPYPWFAKDEPSRHIVHPNWHLLNSQTGETINYE